MDDSDEIKNRYELWDMNIPVQYVKQFPGTSILLDGVELDCVSVELEIDMTPDHMKN